MSVHALHQRQQEKHYSNYSGHAGKQRWALLVAHGLLLQAMATKHQ